MVEFADKLAIGRHKILSDIAIISRPPGSATHATRIIDGAPRLISQGNINVLFLEHGPAPSLKRINNGAVHLVYDQADVAIARPAMQAALSQSGRPVAADAQSLALLTLANRVGASDIPVLVEGPTGTGKEVLARYLHNANARHSGPFIAVNCAAMPEAMLEAMLFGHCKGAFTGASAAGEGFFRAADGGTLLLDEIGEMPLALQAKLLRTLQEGEVVPLGATKPIKVDVRIIACTNRDLTQAVAQGEFREDLLYRLNVFPLRLPALAQRPADIAPLAFHMLLRHSARDAGPVWIGADALDMLQAHHWPGNVRELENVMRRALLLASDSQVVDASHILFDPAASTDAAMPMAPGGMVIPFARNTACGANPPLSKIAFESEAQAIIDTLRECGGHRGKTAERLGISERTLRYRLADMRDAGLAIAGGKI